MPLTRVTGNVITDGTITNADISPTAAISSSKINFIDIVDVKAYGAQGNGIADDTAAIQAAIDACPAAGAVYFPRGSYKAARIQITKSVTIFGDGIDVTEWVYGLQYGLQQFPVGPGADAYFVVSGQNTKFYIRYGTIVDKFGLRAMGEGITPIPGLFPIVTTAIGCLDAYSTNAATFPAVVDAKNVKFLDFWDHIQLSARSFDVQNCQFLLTHGKAGIGQPTASLSAPVSGHPCCGILGVFGSEIVKNNEYDGLLDYTFSGAPTGYLPYRVGGDGFVFTQGRDWATNAWNLNSDGKKECSYNVVRNHYVEGIQYNFAAATLATQFQTLNVSNNYLMPQQRNFVDGWTYMPCIAMTLSATGTPSIKVCSNYIENAAIGINIDGNSSSFKVPYGNVEVSNNVLSGVVNGIAVTHFSDVDIVSNNTVFCQSKPVKDSTAAVRAAGFPLLGSATSFSNLIGLSILNCKPLVSNNTLSAEYEFDLTTTLSSQASNVLTLASAAGMQSTGWGIFIKYQNKSRFLPVTNVSGNNVTVDVGYLAGTIFPNGSIVYASKGLVPWTAAINTVNQVSNLNQAVYNTTIKGFLQDSGANDISGTGNSFTFINTTAIDVYQKSSQEYPGGFWKSEGFYIRK